jgi:predicted acylesterase/phospholipase RssA
LHAPNKCWAAKDTDTILRRGSKTLLTTPAGTTEEGFDSLVLQGGGCRAFFSLGFLEAAGDAPALAALTQLAAVSASTAMACAHLIGCHREAMELFAAKVRDNPKNFYFSRLLQGRHPMPHHLMYRSALLQVLPQAQFLRLREHPSRLRIAVSRSRVSSAAVTVALGAYYVLTKRHPPGLQLHVIEAQCLPDRQGLVDAILASSAFPPFTPAAQWAGRPVIDGGALAPIPLGALDASTARRPLVILTRPWPVVPLPPGTCYIAPPWELRLPTWEYSDEPAIRRVYALGLQAGEQFRRRGLTQVAKGEACSRPGSDCAARARR